MSQIKFSIAGKIIKYNKHKTNLPFQSGFSRCAIKPVKMFDIFV